MKLLIIASLLAASTGVWAQELPERVRKAGKLVIATQPNYPPIAYKDPETNQLRGFDIELGDAIARELGVKVEWQETAFAQVFASLATGRVDFALIGIGDFPSRRETVDFVDYMHTGAQFYTTVARSRDLKAVVDLCGKKVGASRSTQWPKQIGDVSKTVCEAAGKPPIEVIGTEGSADARTQLKSGRIDAGVQGNETLPYAQTVEPNTYLTIGTPFTDALVGMPFAKTDTALRDAVKAALERLQRNGSYDRLLAKYNLRANKWSPVTVNEGK